MSTKEVRFAVMIDSTFLKKWQIECIQKLVAIKDVQLNCFFINDDVEKNFNFKSSIGYRFLERSIRNKGALEVQAISNYFPVSKIIPLKPEKDRFLHRFKSARFRNYKIAQLGFYPPLWIWNFKRRCFNCSKVRYLVFPSRRS